MQTRSLRQPEKLPWCDPSRPPPAPMGPLGESSRPGGRVVTLQGSYSPSPAGRDHKRPRRPPQPPGGGRGVEPGDSSTCRGTGGAEREAARRHTPAPPPPRPPPRPLPFLPTVAPAAEPGPSHPAGPRREREGGGTVPGLPS